MRMQPNVVAMAMNINIISHPTQNVNAWGWPSIALYSTTKNASTGSWSDWMFSWQVQASWPNPWRTSMPLLAPSSWTKRSWLLRTTRDLQSHLARSESWNLSRKHSNNYILHRSTEIHYRSSPKMETTLYRIWLVTRSEQIEYTRHIKFGTAENIVVDQSPGNSMKGKGVQTTSAMRAWRATMSKNSPNSFLDSRSIQSNVIWVAACRNN